MDNYKYTEPTTLDYLDEAIWCLEAASETFSDENPAVFEQEFVAACNVLYKLLETVKDYQDPLSEGEP